MEPFPVQLRQRVDIWSAGCVFSEAAVWSTFGRNRLLEYRRQREEEIRERLKEPGEQWFHDEKEVLETVRGIHENIARNQQPINQVTVNILRVVSNNMLLREDQRDTTARDIYTQFSRIIDTTRSTFGIHVMGSPSRKGESTKDDSDSDGPPKTPPNVPPGYISKSSEPSHVRANPYIRNSLVSQPAPLNQRRSNIPDLQVRTKFRPYHTQATNRKYKAQPAETSFGPFQFDSNSLYSLPDPPSPTSAGESSDANTDNLIPLNANAAYQETVSQSSNHEFRNTMDYVSLIRSRSRRDSLNHSHHHRNRSTRGSFNDPANLRGSQLPMAILSPSSSHDGTMPSRRTDKRISAAPQAQTHRNAPPQLLFSEALLWKERRKKTPYHPLPGDENLASLNVRDHVGVSVFQGMTCACAFADVLPRSL